MALLPAHRTSIAGLAVNSAILFYLTCYPFFFVLAVNRREPPSPEAGQAGGPAERQGRDHEPRWRAERGGEGVVAQLPTQREPGQDRAARGDLAHAAAGELVQVPRQVGQAGVQGG